jgi:HicB_like antitoxin of bacterial toxin-antitoxin system
MAQKLYFVRTTRAPGSATILAMTVLTSGNTVYTHPVAKVMISIPDRLLERIDSHAKSTKETRSGFLQRLAEREIAAGDVSRRKEIEELLGPPVPMGGEAARLIREDRESH